MSLLREISVQCLYVESDVICAALSTSTLAVSGVIEQNPVRIGDAATGSVNQRTGSVAIGFGAAVFNQGANSVAVGTNVGVVNQGDGAIALGVHAGVTNQHPYTICINADATTSVNTAQPSSLYINPVRGVSSLDLSTAPVALGLLYYNPVSREIVYATPEP